MKYCHFSNGNIVLKLSKNVIRHLRLNHDGVELNINDVGLIKVATKKDKASLVKFYDGDKNCTMTFHRIKAGCKTTLFNNLTWTT